MIQGLRWYQGKRLVASVRNSDYAHAGEEEAINRCLASFSKNKNRLILDAGCGQGGTANFIQRQGWGQVTGCDIEKSSIDYAKNHYPEIEFITADVVDVSKKLKGRKFDLICLFNAFYAFPDQARALKALRTLAKEETDLVVFEYSDLTPDGNNPLVVNGDPIKAFSPIRLDTIRDLALEAGWACTGIQELNTEYQRWYENLLRGLKEKRETIIARFSEQGYLKAVNRYTKIYNAIEKKILGGCVFYGKALSIHPLKD